jgi:hypothetical protein
MKNPRNPSLSANQKTQSSHFFLQDSSLTTALPPENPSAETKFRDQPSELIPKKESAPTSHPDGVHEESNDAEMEKLREENVRLKAELERYRAEEIKKIQCQPGESQYPLSQTLTGKEKETKLAPPSSWSSQSLMSAPKPSLKPGDQKVLRQLLQYVAEGEQYQAEALIQTDKNLLLHSGMVKDLSGREFKPITAFQYALWAMDWHMWTMIQKYLPQEAQAKQLRELETKETPPHEKSFSLKGLINALQMYVDNAERIWKYDQRAVDHWSKIVGGEQKLLPAHIVNEYCRGDRPFEPCPQEWESELPRTREIPEIWDNTQSKYIKGSWFMSCSSKDALGVSYAFLRYNRCGEVYEAVWVREVGADLKALQSLWETRTKQLELLKYKLLSSASYNQTFGAR